jgi:hypothetical protein
MAHPRLIMTDMTGWLCCRLATGLYVIIDVQCQCCNHVLGWKYLKACNYDQKYKEGSTLVQQDALVRVDVVDKDSSHAAGSCDP